MRGAAKTFALIALALASAACGGTPRDGSANNSATMDIEALPPDESVDAPADELLNNANEPANAEGLVEEDVAG